VEQPFVPWRARLAELLVAELGLTVLSSMRGPMLALCGSRFLVGRMWSTEAVGSNLLLALVEEEQRGRRNWNHDLGIAPGKSLADEIELAPPPAPVLHLERAPRTSRC